MGRNPGGGEVGRLLQTCFFSSCVFDCMPLSLCTMRFTLIRLEMDLCGEGFGINANAVVLVIQGCVSGRLINYCTAVMKYWNAHAQYQNYRKSILL